MGVRILHDTEDDYCCFYCSTTMQAFGMIMYSLEEAEEFQEWLKQFHKDPRAYKDNELENKYYEFKRQRERE